MAFAIAAVPVQAQVKNITLKASNTPVSTVMQQIEEQSGYTFFYNTKDIPLDRNVTLSVANKDIRAALDELFRNTNVSYSIDNKSIILSARGGAQPQQASQITGRIVDKNGVPVIGYGTRELPAFYTRKSGFAVDYEIDTPAELAKAFYVKQDMGLGGGMLVTNPIPEEYSMDADVINKAIDEAVEEAKAQGIHGKETTPFLLAKIKDLTGGDSLASNIQLVYNNAKLAAATAVELSKLAKN